MRQRQSTPIHMEGLMTQANHIDRRKALSVFAAVPAAVALSVPALAGEDAELLDLWGKLKAEHETL
jgi:hypothetical protein